MAAAQSTGPWIPSLAKGQPSAKWGSQKGVCWVGSVPAKFTSFLESQNVPLFVNRVIAGIISYNKVLPESGGP